MAKAARSLAYPDGRRSSMNENACKTFMTMLMTTTVRADGVTEWRVGGLLHRTDGPAREHPNGTKEWYASGQRHREDGPAVECADGTRIWYVNGERHREDGPAVADGHKEWWLNGSLHRIDGPAIEYPDGKSEYWYRGERISKKVFFSREFQVKMVMEE